MVTAKHRAFDLLRRYRMLERKHEEIGRELEAERERTRGGFDRDFDASLDDDIGDDLLRLVFIACHPILSTEARVEIERAASLTRNAGERTLLLERAASCVTRSPSSHRS
jgi:predicted RNA polymerase sigma factor